MTFQLQSQRLVNGQSPSVTTIGPRHDVCLQFIIILGRRRSRRSIADGL